MYTKYKHANQYLADLLLLHAISQYFMKTAELTALSYLWSSFCCSDATLSFNDFSRFSCASRSHSLSAFKISIYTRQQHKSDEQKNMYTNIHCIYRYMYILETQRTRKSFVSKFLWLSQ